MVMAQKLHCDRCDKDLSWAADHSREMRPTKWQVTVTSDGPLGMNGLRTPTQEILDLCTPCMVAEAQKRDG